MQRFEKIREMQPDPTFEYFSDEEMEEFEAFFSAPDVTPTKAALKLKAKLKNGKS